jgi:hypothetical protein
MTTDEMVEALEDTLAAANDKKNEEEEGSNIHIDAFGQEVNKDDFVVVSLEWIATKGKVDLFKVLRASSKYKMLKVSRGESRPKYVYANTVYKPTPEQLTYVLLKGS